MDAYKLRIKLESDEFEAEGSQEFVEKQRDIFLDRIEQIESPTGGPHQGKPVIDSKKNQKKNPAGHSPVDPKTPPPSTPQNLPISVADMSKIVQQTDNLITLTAMPAGDNAEGDSLLLLLLAHKILRSEDLIQAGDLVAGMKQSGFHTVGRLDRVTPKIEKSFVSSVGSRKGKKYRLLNPGILKAKELAEKLIGTVS